MKDKLTRKEAYDLCILLGISKTITENYLGGNCLGDTSTLDTFEVLHDIHEVLNCNEPDYALITDNALDLTEKELDSLLSYSSSAERFLRNLEIIEDKFGDVVYIEIDTEKRLYIHVDELDIKFYPMFVCGTITSFLVEV